MAAAAEMVGTMEPRRLQQIMELQINKRMAL